MDINDFEDEKLYKIRDIAIELGYGKPPHGARRLNKELQKLGVQYYGVDGNWELCKDYRGMNYTKVRYYNYGGIETSRNLWTESGRKLIFDLIKLKNKNKLEDKMKIDILKEIEEIIRENEKLKFENKELIGKLKTIHNFSKSDILPCNDVKYPESKFNGSNLSNLGKVFYSLKTKRNVVLYTALRHVGACSVREFLNIIGVKYDINKFTQALMVHVESEKEFIDKANEYLSDIKNYK